MFNSKTVAIVTGASKGFGRAVVCSLAREFSLNEDGRKSVFILIARSREGLEETKNVVANISGEIKVHVIPGDLGDLSHLPQLVSEVLHKVEPSQFSSAILVNNAGTLGDASKTIRDHSDIQAINNHMQLNITSPFYLTSQFLTVFHSVKQYVVNISTLCAVRPTPSLSLYCTSKAALDMLNQVLAEESKDVRALNYAPGPLKTEMFYDILNNSASSELKKMFKETIDSGSLLTADTSADKLVILLKQDHYKSGAHIDYFDELP